MNSKQNQHALLIIDDAKIRRQAFQPVEKLLKKIDRLESSVMAYHEKDQQLFSSWFDLTFRENQKRISALQEEFKKISIFHNWIVGVADLENISLAEAYKFLRDEQERYSTATAEERAKIDELRKQRDEFIEQAMKEEFDFDSDDFFSEDDFEDDEDFEDFDQGKSPEEIAAFQKIAAMSDKKIHKICKNFEDAFDLIGIIMRMGFGKEQMVLMVRVWDLCPHKVRVRLGKDYRTHMGESLEGLIDEMRMALQELGDKEPPQKNDETNFSFAASGLNENARATVAKDESLKILFRKLVRRLHPDMQAENLHPEPLWQTKIWHQAQSAWKQKDQVQLENLYRMTLLRMGEVNELTLSEIEESVDLLEAEFKKTEDEAKNFKKFPAWKFSTRKNYDVLIAKISKEFRDEAHSIEIEIERIREQHQILEMMSQREAMSRSRKRRKKSSKLKIDPVQSSFFD